MATVYIETTIPSFYHETRESAEAVVWRAATRSWWDSWRHRYELVSSDVVLREIGRAPAEKSGPGVEMLKGLRLLERTDRVEAVAAEYLKHRLLPGEALADALHLALASVHGVDYLLTWNCKHLANAAKARHIEVLNRRLRVSVPIVTTPLTLLPEQADGQ